MFANYLKLLNNKLHNKHYKLSRVEGVLSS